MGGIDADSFESTEGKKFNINVVEMRQTEESSRMQQAETIHRGFC